MISNRCTVGSYGVTDQGAQLALVAENDTVAPLEVPKSACGSLRWKLGVGAVDEKQAS